MAYNYWFAYVGNVLGTSGESTAGERLGEYRQFGAYTNQKMIWFSGWLRWRMAASIDTHLGTHDVQRLHPARRQLRLSQQLGDLGFG